jgi:hypothetical protein
MSTWSFPHLDSETSDVQPQGVRDDLDHLLLSLRFVTKLYHSLIRVSSSNSTHNQTVHGSLFFDTPLSKGWTENLFPVARVSHSTMINGELELSAEVQLPVTHR